MQNWILEDLSDVAFGHITKENLQLAKRLTIKFSEARPAVVKTILKMIKGVKNVG